MFLTRYAKRKTCVREPDFTCARTVAEKALNHPKIEVFSSTKSGGRRRQCAEIRRVCKQSDGREDTLRVPEGDSLGVFIFAGYVPQSMPLRAYWSLTSSAM